MKKNCRWLTALAVVGTVIGLVIAYICKKNHEASMDEDVFEDEDDFALDSDLKPVSEREYVPLKTDAQTQKKESEDVASENSEEISAEKEDVPSTTEEAQEQTLEGTEEDKLSGNE